MSGENKLEGRQNDKLERLNSFELTFLRGMTLAMIVRRRAPDQGEKFFRCQIRSQHADCIILTVEHCVDSIAGEAIKWNSRLRIEKDFGVFRCIFLCSEESETDDRKPVSSKDSD